MEARDCGAIPVVEKNGRKKLIGVITDRDIACRAVARGKDPVTTKVADCMSSPVATIEQDSTMEDCCDLMEKSKVRRIMVVDEQGDLCGIVAQADIALRTRAGTTAGVVREVSEPTHEPSRV
jgi:CBS domain-containing protein